MEAEKRVLVRISFIRLLPLCFKPEPGLTLISISARGSGSGRLKLRVYGVHPWMDWMPESTSTRTAARAPTGHRGCTSLLYLRLQLLARALDVR